MLQFYRGIQARASVLTQRWLRLGIPKVCHEDG